MSAYRDAGPCLSAAIPPTNIAVTGVSGIRPNRAESRRRTASSVPETRGKFAKRRTDGITAITSGKMIKFKTNLTEK